MAKRWLGMAFMLFVAFGLVACNQGGTETQKPKEESNTDVTLSEQELYSNNCMSCHGGNLQGGVGPALDKIGAKLTKEELIDIMKNGKGSMPSMPQMSDQAQEKLADWLVNKK